MRTARENDQAWIEQKNGSVIRRFVGHERYSGPMAGQTMAHLYGAMRLYVNHFQLRMERVKLNQIQTSSTSGRRSNCWSVLVTAGP